MRFPYCQQAYHCSHAIRVTLAVILVSLCAIAALKYVSTIREEFTTGPEPFIITAEPRTDRSLEIAIVIVLTNGSDVDSYRTAMNSIENYSSLHGYKLLVEEDTKYKECERHADKFFKRHCHTHQLMLNELSESSWVLFIDADVGVVDPNKLIDDFIEPEFDIYLYNRFYNWEFAAQYLLKNNDRGRKWLSTWAEMEFTLPKSFHGTDNGALHILMMHYLSPEAANRDSSIGRLCRSMWESSANMNDLFTMQACTRLVIGERSLFPEQHVKIFPKGRGWARDLWLLRSRWSFDDFMLHSIKEQRLHPERIAKRDLNYDLIYPTRDTNDHWLAFPVLNITESENGEKRWTMDGRFKITNVWRTNLFNRILNMKLQKQYEHLGNYISKFVQNE